MVGCGWENQPKFNDFELPLSILLLKQSRRCVNPFSFNRLIIPFFKFSSKMMSILSEGSHIPHCIFLVQVLFKTNGYPLWEALSSPSQYSLCHVYSNIINILSGGSLLALYMFNNHFLSKSYGYPPFVAPSFPSPYSLFVLKTD